MTRQKPPQYKPNWNETWAWMATGDRARAALEVLLPQLGERRRAKALEKMEAFDAYREEVTRARTCQGCGELFRPVHLDVRSADVLFEELWAEGVQGRRAAAAMGLKWRGMLPVWERGGDPSDVKRFGGPAGSYTYNGVSYPYGYSFTMQPPRKNKSTPPTQATPHGLPAVWRRLRPDARQGQPVLGSEVPVAPVPQRRPGPLFGNTELEALEAPWPNATTGDLLSRLIQDYDLTSNFYGRRTGDGVTPLRPDWVDRCWLEHGHG